MTEKDFLNGVVMVRVTSLEQSQYLIDLAEQNRLEGNGIFEPYSFLEFPYYFIQNREQLNATKDPGFDMSLEGITKLLRFEDVFQTIY